MDPEQLKTAGEEMEKAETRMNENEKIIALRNARKDFQTMMDNVNQILRLVITGTVDDQGASGGCSGQCDQCGGCR